MAIDYEISTSTYAHDKMYDLPNDEWAKKCKSWKEDASQKMMLKEWQKRYFEDKRFFDKYGDLKYECSPKMMQKRAKAFYLKYNVPLDSYVGANCIFRCSHYVPGTTPALSIGHHVMLTENVFIDYTGQIKIGDGTIMANGAIIETHEQDFKKWHEGIDINVPNELSIGRKVYIGSRAIILSGCHSIGDRAIVAAGAVVTKDVPANSLVAGVPAKVIKMLEN